MPRLMVLIYFIVALANATPQLINLYKFTSFASYDINDVEVGAKVYLASTDKTEYLKNIVLESGTNSITLDQINDVNDDGTAMSFPIVANLTLTTTNNNTVSTNLYGSLYITNKQQADDPNFSVYVIRNSHTISKTSMQSTTVVLNTALRTESVDMDQPRRTAYVTDINHSDNKNVYFQWGIPLANYQTLRNNTFFRNPIVIQNITAITRHFFDHVEPLQVALDCWYITAMGPFNMKLENKYVPNHEYTTTAVNTTGIIVNNNWIYEEHIVNFTPDLTRSGTGGVFTSAYIDSDLLVRMNYGTNGISNALKSKENETQTYYVTYEQATKLTVNSSTYLPGYFYCQYFTFAGDLYPITSPLPTTSAPTTVPQTSTAVSTTTVGTTTKGSTYMLEIQLIALLSIVVNLS